MITLLVIMKKIGNDKRLEIIKIMIRLGVQTPLITLQQLRRQKAPSKSVLIFLIGFSLYSFLYDDHGVAGDQINLK